MRVLLTRPQPGADQTAAKLVARGFDPIIAPLFDIVPRDAARQQFDALNPGDVQALVMTSANAARAMQALNRVDAYSACPVWCVGQATANAARNAGFADVRSPAEAGDGRRLVDILAAALAQSEGVVVHLGGETLSTDVSGMLRERGFMTSRIVIYQAQARSSLPETVRAALLDGSLESVLLYSPRAAERFVALMGPIRSTIWWLCLSQQVADVLRHHRLGDGSILVAEQPDEDALLACLDIARDRASKDRDTGTLTVEE